MRKPLYHGTNLNFDIGQVILPANIAGVESNYDQFTYMNLVSGKEETVLEGLSDHAFATTDIGEASDAAERALERKGGATARIYRVSPMDVSDVEFDPNSTDGVRSRLGFKVQAERVGEIESYKLAGPGGYKSRINLSALGARDTSLKPIGKSPGKMPAFILDLDQTIWDTSDEAKAIEKDLIERLKPEKGGFLTAKDWTEWRYAAEDVTEIPEMTDFVRRMQESGIKPVIMTARDRANEPMVRNVLREYGISTDHLMFRGLSQTAQDTPSDILKMHMMQRSSRQFNFLAMLDDSAANLKGAHKFGVPLVIQPEKMGFDSLQASVVRGIEISGGMGESTLSNAERTLEPIIRAGTQGEKSISKILEAGEVAAKVMRFRT
jgi:phosphoglycolate phosphatase-like HAD superfamily hydrolase